MRGSNQPHVDLVSPSAPQTLKLLFLQYAEQLGLQGRWNITYLVQKQCAFVGHFETANLLRNGPGECTFLVAKELAFQKIQRDRRTIHFHKRPPAPGAEVVDRVGDQLFAGACFSLDQDGGVRRRYAFDLFEYCFESRTAAYNPLEAPLLPILIAWPELLQKFYR